MVERSDLGDLSLEAHFIAELAAEERLRNRRDPADAAVRGIRFVFADERVAALRAIFQMQSHTHTEAHFGRRRFRSDQLRGGLALLPVAQLAIDTRERVLVFAALGFLARGFELAEVIFDLLQAAGSDEIRVRADRPLRQVLRHLGSVVLAHECPAHGPSIALVLRYRHRQLSGSKLTTGQPAQNQSCPHF